MTIKQDYIKGRGAQINTANPFSKHNATENGMKWHDEDEIQKLKKTQYIPNHPKTILNKVTSPDIAMDYSLNPYQGCEHGCVYCYARNTHTYWGYSAGIEFEQKILIKENAPELLEKKLKSKNWKPIPIMLSGNTDCYQPAEKKYMITRKILEILWKYRHPVGIITKNQLILRDLDILNKMGKHNLIKTTISITTLDENLRSKLEPRTTSGKSRLKIVQKLADAGIPVNIMMAPIIPSFNDKEIFDIAEKTAAMGATSFNYTIVRLNGDIATIFSDWLLKNFPDRWERVMHQIQNCHGGTLNDHRFCKRMSGEGNIADVIKQQVKIAKEKFFGAQAKSEYNTNLYEQIKNPQMKLF